MVITFLEAHVDADKWSAFERTFNKQVRKLDPGITQTLLVHNTKDPTLWRIATVWESREALDAMRNSGETPRGVVMFRSVGAEPTLSVFDVVAHSG